MLTTSAVHQPSLYKKSQCGLKTDEDAMYEGHRLAAQGATRKLHMMTDVSMQTHRRHQLKFGFSGGVVATRGHVEGVFHLLSSTLADGVL
ncbi:hypothetical protein SCP_1300250 [Sparassis crispa]|uniref:Uncharacterized protein n=1 Tax=Sparassis crispa TaxID=139825 RepID=A0A401H1A5_9APHY|nr:hypothetical protein SCP_1300250 [Sparassis crispa]GBE88211.1 hypothetical protein SCP_1300250 [Sparassis crispa]